MKKLFKKLIIPVSPKECYVARVGALLRFSSTLLMRTWKFSCTLLCSNVQTKEILLLLEDLKKTNLLNSSLSGG